MHMKGEPSIKRQNGIGSVSLMTDLFAVDLDSTVDDKLASLSYTAGEHGAEHCRVQSSLQGRKSHLHIGCHILEVLRQHLVHIAETTTSLSRMRGRADCIIALGDLGVGLGGHIGCRQA